MLNLAVAREELLDLRGTGFREHTDLGLRASLEEKVKLFFGDLRPSEDVDLSLLGLEENGELGIHR